MARKTHAIGFRLGEGSWWETRTPPRIGREGTQGIEKRVIKGMMEKYGYSITEPLIKRKGNGESEITIVGGRGPIGINPPSPQIPFKEYGGILGGAREENQKVTPEQEKGGVGKEVGGTLEKYMISYLKEWIKKYTSEGLGKEGRKVDMSYRESENWNNNAEQIFKHIVKNERLIITTMRRIKRMGEARALVSGIKIGKG